MISVKTPERVASACSGRGLWSVSYTSVFVPTGDLSITGQGPALELQMPRQLSSL